MSIPEYSIRHKPVIYLIILLIVVGGLVAYQNLGKLEDPEFTIKTAIIVTPYPGASAYEVEQQVTDVVEKAAQSADEVDNVHSISRAGLSVVYVDLKEYNRSDRIQQLWDILRRKVNAAQAELPDGAGPSQVQDDFGDVYGIFLALTGDNFTKAEMKKYAEFIQRELLLVKDVSRIQIFGTRTECINIDISTAKSASLGLSPNRIIATLQNQNKVVYPGALQTDQRRVRVNYPGDFQSIDEIGQLVVGGKGAEKITLGDIADISRGYLEPPEPSMRFNGKPAIGITISATAQANVIAMGDAVQARLDELFKDLPIGLEIEGVYYQSRFVKGAIKNFITNLLQSVGIVIGVLLIAMGLRSGLMIASGLVLSILGTLIIMLVWGIELQRISLASLILAMGMIVDNAIVVVDGTLISLKLGYKKDQAVVQSAASTAWPLLGSTIIACLAFLPIFMSPNNSGEYCRSLFQVISIALLSSWVLAMTQTPVFGYLFLHPPKNKVEQDPFTSRPYRIYKNFLQLCLRHKLICGLLLIGLCIFAGIGMEKVPKMFFANSDKTQFFIDYWMPEGTRIERVSDGLILLEKHLAGLPEIKNYTTVIGSGSPRFAANLTPEPENKVYAQIIVNVNDYLDIPALQTSIYAWLTENIPDCDPKMRSFISGPPADYKVEARFSGPDPAVLRNLAEQTKEIMRADPDAKYVRDDWRMRVPIWEPVYSQQRARDAGVERQDVAIAILNSTDGLTAATYREGNDLLPVHIRTANESDIKIPSPESTPVWGDGSASIPLGQVADFANLSWEDPIVRRYDRRRAITVKCDTAENVTSGILLARLRPKIESIPMPAGYTLEWAGENELSVKGNAGVQKFMPLALLMMLFILVVLFNDFRKPIIIVLVTPLALTGMVAGLLFTGQPFGFLALLGAYSLIGMLIKNAVVLIDQIELNIKEGKAPYTAVIESSISRLRPVCMASATTIFGMIPLLGDAMFVSMAVTIMFGLAMATLLTLVVVPLLYTLFFRIPAKA